MADPTNVLSDSPSLLRLRQTKSPFLSRRSLVFEKPVELKSHAPDSLRPRPQARPLSFHTSSEFLLKLSAFENYSQDHLPKFGDTLTIHSARSRPILSGKVGKLVTSFSNPSLLKADTVAGEKRLQKVKKLNRSQSQFIKPLESVEEDYASCTVTQLDPNVKAPVDDTPEAIEEPVGETPEANEDVSATVIQPFKTFIKRNRKSESMTVVPIGPIARRNFRDNRPTLQEVDSNNFISLNFIPGRVNIKYDGPLGAPSLSMQFSPYSPNTPSLYKPLTPREDDDDDESVVEEELDDHELRGTHDNVAAL
ncbi:hypothetical protein BGZ81_002743, partial [Podila clonocystis]